MNKEILQKILEDEGFRPDYYYLDGGLLPERLTLAREGGLWTVYYSERGLKSGKKDFATEGEACEYLLLRLRNDAGAKRLSSDQKAEIIRNSRNPRAVCNVLKTQRLVIVGHWSDPQSNQITIQDFSRDGEVFIPVFSDEEHFRAEIGGSGFEGDGMSIDCDLLRSMLKGDELLILNPGSANPIRLHKSDFT